LVQFEKSSGVPPFAQITRKGWVTRDRSGLALGRQPVRKGLAWLA
jgi:hypothetical protein